MKLGIFDSGLGGLQITRAVRDAIPDIDILYYGDTLHLPYGNRSDTAIYHYTKSAMERMFEAGCILIIIACNTASAAALRKLQQEWLPTAYPDRNILGVVVPTLETALDQNLTTLGLIATNYIVNSGVYPEELNKIKAGVTIHQCATPLLVPLIEHDGDAWVEDVLRHYLTPLITEYSIEGLILACTHYAAIKGQIRRICGSNIRVLTQDEIIPDKLISYLNNHPEYTDKINKNRSSDFYVSDITDNYMKAARQIYGTDISIEHWKHD